jgi:hypothetical protein
MKESFPSFAVQHGLTERLREGWSQRGQVDNTSKGLATQGRFAKTQAIALAFVDDSCMKLKLRSCLAGEFSVFLALVNIEAASELGHRLYQGKWYFRERQNSPRGLAQLHPYFGACFVPNVSEESGGVRITHNSFRSRGPDFDRPKLPGRIRIATLGGS